MDFITPVGRIVQGGMGNPRTHDAVTKQPLIYKSGAQAGQPRVEFYFGLAIAKNDPELPAFELLLGQVAGTAWPAGEGNRPDFSWKILDGDGVDKAGKSYTEREGHAGHKIFKFSGSFAPRCSVQTAPQQWIEVAPDSIKKGDYIRVSGSAEGNKNAVNPGIYLNYDQIQHIGVGVAISSGASAADAFGTAPVAAMPVGATAPVAPAAPFAAAAAAAVPVAAVAPVAAVPVAAVAPVAAVPVAAVAPVAAVPVAAVAPVAAVPVAAVAPVAAVPVAAVAPVAAVPVAAAPIAVAPAVLPNPAFAVAPVA